MSVLELWKSEHLCGKAFMMGEAAKEAGLSVSSANGVVVFSGTSNHPLAKELLGKTFNHLFEEILVEKPVVKPVVNVPKVEEKTE